MSRFPVVLIACLGSLLAPVPAAAQTAPAELTAEDMRVLARDLLNAGRPSDAGEVLNAVLDRDPNDAAALVLGAQAALDQGQPAAAVDLAGRAYGNAPDDTTRYVAARLTALGHATLQQDTRAQFWLRRARQVAPTAEEAASVAQDYAFLRNRNPLSFNLTFGAAPSSNINNGSRSDTARIGSFVTVLSESAKPLSGVEINAGATLSYVLRESERSQTTVVFDLRTTNYALSQTAKDALQRDIDNTTGDTSDLPRSGNDFSYTEASVDLVQRYIITPGGRPTTFDVKLGRSWYGGDPYQDFVQAGVSHVFLLSPAESLRLDTFYRYNADIQPDSTTAGGSRDDFNDVASLGLGLTYARQIESGDILSLSLSPRRNVSDNSENDYTSMRLGAGLDLAQPFMAVRFGFGAQFEERKFDRSVYVTGIRRDRIVTGQVTALFDSVEYYGFVPAVTLSIGRTFSPAERFDTQYVNLGVDLRSAF